MRSGEVSRRDLIAAAARGGALAVIGGRTIDAAGAELARGSSEVRLMVNGAVASVTLDPRVTLLDALREHLDLTGTKKGCDHGQCGACTVLVGGQRVLACLTLAATMGDGSPIQTIEGLESGDALHPMQAAFIEHDALQCGYCTPGQIMSAIGLLGEGRPADDEAIREGMAGNICRCGAYEGVVAAVRHVRDGGTGP